MKHSRRLLMLLGLAVILFTASAAHAQTGGPYELVWSTIDGGGGATGGGFWGGGGILSVGSAYDVYLPLAIK